MTLLWTGIWHWALLLPLAALLCAFTVWVYRKQQAPSPWRILLPLLRCLALLLLVLALLQPVLARFSRELQRGELLVLVDDSGSMSVTDRYEPENAVDLAWTLNLFPRRLRFTGFEDAERLEAWGELKEALSSEQLSLGDLRDASDDLEKWLRQLAKDLEDFAYAADPEPELLAQWKQQTDALQKDMQEEIRLVEEARKADQKRQPRAPDAERWTELEEGYAELQGELDRALAEAEIEEVDAALEQLKDVSRMELLQKIWLEEDVDLFAKLEEKGEVKLFGLESGEQALPEPLLEELNAEHAASRLGTALRDAVKGRGETPLTGVLLISDGNQNAGMTLGQFGDWFTGRNVPLLALGVGESEPADDLVIERVIAPESAFVDDRLSLRVRVSRHGYTEKELTLRVMHEEKQLHEQKIPPGELERIWVDVGFIEDEKGERDYRIELDVEEEEWLERNNYRNVQVNVLDDPIRVLLVDAWPRWETRYLDMMLQRDPRVECRSIFYGSSESGTLRSGEDQYPETREDLFGFEVVVLGDVDPDQFSRGQLEDLHAFVEERGGTLIWIAGSRYMPTAYPSTPLWDLAPFRLEEGRDEEDEEREAQEVFRVQLTETGKHDPMALISNSDEVSRRLWEELPPLPWVRTGVTALPLADRTAETREEQAPVLIKSYRGLGKLVYIGSDSFWRWRDRSRWTYHQRLWGQIILWSALGRTSGSDRYVKLMTDRLRYATGEQVTLRAKLLDEKGRPISEADAFVEIFDERGEQVRKLPLKELSGGGAAYEATLSGLPEGAYTARPEVFELRGKEVQAEIQFRIGELPTSEYVRLTYDEGALQEVTDHVAPLWKPDALLELLEPVEQENTRREDLELWNHPLYLLLVLALLSTEWGLRRRRRMP